MKPSPKNNRRTLFIQPAFQGRFIGWMLAMIVAFGVISAAILYFLLASDLENETHSAHLRIADTWQKLGMSIMLGNVVSALFTGISVVVVVLYASHKVAGPMYRFQALFKEVGNGNLEVGVHLRDGDQLQELAKSFDEMLSGLRSAQLHRTELIDQTRAVVDKLEAAAPDDETLRRELMADLRRRLVGIKESGR